MTSAPGLVDDRIIFYRHLDANFYGAFSYAFGKAASLLPQVRSPVSFCIPVRYFTHFTHYLPYAI